MGDHNNIPRGSKCSRCGFGIKEYGSNLCCDCNPQYHTCGLNNCNNTRASNDRGGFHKYCGKNHAILANAVPIPQCKGTACTNPVWIDFQKTRVHDFCGQRCAKASGALHQRY